MNGHHPLSFWQAPGAPKSIQFGLQIILLGLKYQLLRPLGPQQGPGDLQEASKSIFASTFDLYSSPVGYRCVSENVFFLMFCVGLRLHALRG